MSYHIYTTKGLMLSYRPLREADRVYSILTRDLGLIRATAIGVRKESSKLRGSLEPVTLAKVSLVRGKEYWRVTSVLFENKVEPTPFLLRPLALLERLVQGEAPHSELFDVIEKFVSRDSKDELFEINFVASLLYHLGYLTKAALKLERKALLKAINEGLESSQLTLQ